MCTWEQVECLFVKTNPHLVLKILRLCSEGEKNPCRFYFTTTPTGKVDTNITKITFKIDEACDLDQCPAKQETTAVTAQGAGHARKSIISGRGYRATATTLMNKGKNHYKARTRGPLALSAAASSEIGRDSKAIMSGSSCRASGLGIRKDSKAIMSGNNYKATSLGIRKDSKARMSGSNYKVTGRVIGTDSKAIMSGCGPKATDTAPVNKGNGYKAPTRSPFAISTSETGFDQETPAVYRVDAIQKNNTYTQAHVKWDQLIGPS